MTGTHAIDMSDPWIYTILISGQLGSGKSTLQDALFTELSRRLPNTILVIKCNFADELKRECAKRAGVDPKVFYTEEGKLAYYEKVQMTGRELLQTVGEEARERDPCHWIKRAKQSIADAAGTRCVVAVVGDCRHPNEVDMMRPGVAVRLTGDPGGVRARSTADMTHISETAMNDFEHFDLHINTDVTTPEMAVLLVLAWLDTYQQKRLGKLLDDIQPPVD